MCCHNGWAGHWPWSTCAKIHRFLMFAVFFCRAMIFSMLVSVIMRSWNINQTTHTHTGKKLQVINVLILNKLKWNCDCSVTQNIHPSIPLYLLYPHVDGRGLLEPCLNTGGIQWDRWRGTHDIYCVLIKLANTLKCRRIRQEALFGL